MCASVDVVVTVAVVVSLMCCATELASAETAVSAALRNSSSEISSKVFGPLCGGTYRSPVFRLTSPFFPAPYPPNSQCSYIVEAISPRICQLEIDFLTFDVSCDGDSLVVSGETLCGTQIGVRKFRFTQPRDVITFQSGPVSGGRGFDLRVRQIECAPKPLPNCGGVYTRPQFLLTSPNYPLPYPNFAHCVYVVRASSARICDLEIQLQDFNVEASPQCEKDRLEIGDRYNLCGHVTGTIRYQNFLGELRIRFVSDNIVNDRGFKILVTQVPCGSNPTNPIFPPPILPLPPVFPPVFPPNPLPPVLPILPILPPIHRPHPKPPVLPPIFPQHPKPPVFPVPPIYPPIYPPYPTLPQCCNRHYTGHHSFISSPNFPHNPHGPIDCVYHIPRYSPHTCRIRLQFRFFWVGEDLRGCTQGFLDVDGRRICGCQTGLVMILWFEQWEGVKLLRYKNNVGFGKDSLQGFVIEVLQEDCFHGYARRSDGNVTIDHNYRQIRSNLKMIDTDQNSFLQLLNDTLNTTTIQENVFLIRSNESVINSSEEDSEKKVSTSPENNLSNHRLSNESTLILSDRDNSELPKNEVEEPLLSLTPPIFPAKKFTVTSTFTAATFVPLSSAHIPDNTSSSSSFSISSPLSPVPVSQTSVTNHRDSSDEKSDLEERHWPRSCFASGLQEWLRLAKPFLLSGQASCPAMPPQETRCIILDQPAGYLQSPGYPRSYPPNLNTCYSIRRAPGYCRVELKLVDFALEYSKFCKKDYLLVGGKRYCGNSLAGTTTIYDMSTINFAKILFVTDAWTSDRGFRGHYRQLACTVSPPRPPCGYAIRDAQFQLRHNGNGLPGEVCVWPVIAVSNRVYELQVSFVQFSLVCGLETLTIGHREFCGELAGQSAKVNFRGSELRIVYRSRLGAVGRGFHIYGMQLIDPFQLNVDPARALLRNDAADPTRRNLTSAASSNRYVTIGN